MRHCEPTAATPSSPGKAHPHTFGNVVSTHLFLCHGVEVLMVGAEDKVTQDGATLLGHHTLVGQSWPATGVGQVHQDLWQ